MTDSSGRIQLSLNPDQSPNFLFDNKPLHSRHNPEQEAARFAETIRPGPNELVVLVGVGAGYARVLGRVLTPSRIFYYEPIPEFAAFLKQNGFVQEIESQGSKFYTSQEALLKALSGQSGIRIVSSPRHRDFFPDAHQELLRSIRTIDQTTAGRFFGRWSYCFFRNLGKSQFLSFFPIREQSDDGSNGPAVLFCGAAPTLLEDLARFELNNRFIIAADTALAPLLARGILPHLVISIDSGYGTLYHLRAAGRISDLRTLSVLAPLTAHPSLSDFFGKVIRYRSTFPMDQILGDGPLLTIDELVNATRNTAGIAFLAARALRARSFETAGVSFVSTHGDSHVRGTGYLLYALEQNSRTNPIESYRVGGYSESLSNRNMQTRAALNAMLESWAPAPLDEANGLTGKAQLERLEQSLDSGELLRFLEKAWGKIQWEQIGHLARANEVARWKRRLENLSIRQSH